MPSSTNSDIDVSKLEVDHVVHVLKTVEKLCSIEALALMYKYLDLAVNTSSTRERRAHLRAARLHLNIAIGELRDV